jgi:DNA-binding LacI/PurR family transcriptional regulator
VATIRDVARECGVSVATVSYVLNDGPRPVRPETRRVVLETVKRLGYHPNAMARALVHGRVNTLGVLFGRVEPAIVTNSFVTGVLEGIMSTSAHAGYNVTLFTQPWHDAATSSAVFTDGRTDGVLIVAPLQGSGMVEGLSGLGIPLVVVSAAVAAESRIPFVDVDNQRGAAMATEHLLALGHTRIAHLMGEAEQPSAIERRKGFCEALARAGVEVPAHYLVWSNYDSSRAYADVRRLLTGPDRPTAVFAGNDGLALATVAVARDLGIRVPAELSVVGFDDVAVAALVTPPLTTVRQPLAEIGRRATRLLVARIEGKNIAPVSARAEPELVVRGTTAAPS